MDIPLVVCLPLSEPLSSDRKSSMNTSPRALQSCDILMYYCRAWSTPMAVSLNSLQLWSCRRPAVLLLSAVLLFDKQAPSSMSANTLKNKIDEKSDFAPTGIILFYGNCSQGTSYFRDQPVLHCTSMLRQSDHENLRHPATSYIYRGFCTH